MAKYEILIQFSCDDPGLAFRVPYNLQQILYMFLDDHGEVLSMSDGLVPEPELKPELKPELQPEIPTKHPGLDDIPF